MRSQISELSLGELVNKPMSPFIFFPFGTEVAYKVDSKLESYSGIFSNVMAGC